MKEGLFKKYNIQLEQRTHIKKEVIQYIQEKTGIILQEENIVILKKVISLYVSSTLKQKLFQKNISKILKDKGFHLK